METILSEPAFKCVIVFVAFIISNEKSNDNQYSKYTLGMAQKKI